MSAPLLKFLTQVVCREHDKVADLVNRLLDDATQLSEQEICLATASLMQINRDSREHVSDLRRVVTGSQEKRVAAIEMIDHQTHYSRTMQAALQEQVDLARKSMGLSREISGFVEVIGRISSAARILTVNGQIESARMGSLGAAFSVIANEMRDLSAEVQRANQAIADLAGNLVKLMPALDNNAGKLLQNTEAFSAQQADIIKNFQVVAQQESDSLLSTEERAKHISDQVGVMVTHLQFQDRVAQDLREASDRTVEQGKFLKVLLDMLCQRPDLECLTEAQIEECAQSAKAILGGSGRLGARQGRNGTIPEDGVLLF
ncbi:hypothetical protein IV102_26925 [bacterium]|nr:hypothetical protein [bacterium]